MADTTREKKLNFPEITIETFLKLSDEEIKQISDEINKFRECDDEENFDFKKSNEIFEKHTNCAN